MPLAPASQFFGRHCRRRRRRYRRRCCYRRRRRSEATIRHTHRPPKPQPERSRVICMTAPLDPLGYDTTMDEPSDLYPSGPVWGAPSRRRRLGRARRVAERHARPAARRPLRALDERQFAVLAAVAARTVTAPNADPVAIAAARRRADGARRRPRCAPTSASCCCCSRTRSPAWCSTGGRSRSRGCRRRRRTACSPTGATRAWCCAAPATRALRKLTQAAWYASPEAWADVGYPGPPQIADADMSVVLHCTPTERLRRRRRRSPTAPRSRPTSSSSAPAPAAPSPRAQLARAGLEVLVLEEGGHHTRADFKMREDIAYPMLYQEAGARATKDLGAHHPAGARRRRHHRRQLDHQLPHAGTRLRALEEGARRRRDSPSPTSIRTGTRSRSGSTSSRSRYARPTATTARSTTAARRSGSPSTPRGATSRAA